MLRDLPGLESAQPPTHRGQLRGRSVAWPLAPIVLLLTLPALLLPAATRATPPPRPSEASTPRTREATELYLEEPYRARFEATVATAHLFPAALVSQYDDNVELVPSTSVLVILEYIATWWLRVSFLYDLPTTPETRFVDGVAVQAELPSRMAIGLIWAPFYVDFAERSRVEFQGLTYMGLTLEADPRPVPIVGGRIVILPNAETGVGIYLGVIGELVINQVGAMYGVGYRF